LAGQREGELVIVATKHRGSVTGGRAIAVEMQ
jgi:hypothetical protein